MCACGVLCLMLGLLYAAFRNLISCTLPLESSTPHQTALVGLTKILIVETGFSDWMIFLVTVIRVIKLVVTKWLRLGEYKTSDIRCERWTSLPKKNIFFVVNVTILLRAFTLSAYWHLFKLKTASKKNCVSCMKCKFIEAIWMFYFWIWIELRWGICGIREWAKVKVPAKIVIRYVFGMCCVIIKKKIHWISIE